MRMHRRLVAMSAVVCALASVVIDASAQVTASEQHSSTRVPTSSHPDFLMSEGQSLYDAGHYKEAAASFERAIQLGVARPHEAARSVARSYEKLGNRKQAHRWAEIAELIAAGPVRSRLSRDDWVT